ncbi:hypothetical protein SAMN05421788_110165 [Filimonas lacunae]|uniref:Uncharacterized protein n=1 Tax=Filimonas lacunae TaxID=477680 RepID=A0A173MAA4_9BACT|nr:hypothetical protein [Filimonas lacunae]BAV04431.1 hypothetical protein FLA_0422 [Filimonas lacunae]SIT31423.1 hypothetical protein SAMN05421788_110165 [Filimonas lacunae]
MEIFKSDTLPNELLALGVERIHAADDEKGEVLSLYTETMKKKGVCMEVEQRIVENEDGDFEEERTMVSLLWYDDVSGYDFTMFVKDSCDIPLDKLVDYIIPGMKVIEKDKETLVSYLADIAEHYEITKDIDNKSLGDKAYKVMVQRVKNVRELM